MKNLQIIILTLCLTLLPQLGWTQAEGELAEANSYDVPFLDSLDLEKNYFYSDTRAGAIFTTGNTRSLSVTGKSDTILRIRRWQHRWTLGGYYNRIFASTGTITSGTIARYVYGFYRLDYFFAPRTTLFVGGGGYTDTIKGIDLATQAFIGVSHYILYGDDYYFKVSGGYDYTRQNRVAPSSDRNIHAAKIELNYEQKFNSVVSFYQGVDYLQDLVRGHNVRINSDTELRLQMTKLLSLILGFHTRFNNQPAIGFKKLDTITDVALAITFGDAKKKSDCCKE